VAAVKVFYWLTTLLVALLIAVVAVNNDERVQVVLWPILTLQTPLYLVALLPLLLGFLMGALVAWVRGRHWRHEARLRKRRIESLEHEREATRTELSAHGGSGD
jgi:uncharacterized integral membrane protein